MPSHPNKLKMFIAEPTKHGRITEVSVQRVIRAGKVDREEQAAQFLTPAAREARFRAKQIPKFNAAKRDHTGVRHRKVR